jgi:hypothetical protein
MLMRIPCHALCMHHLHWRLYKKCKRWIRVHPYVDPSLQSIAANQSVWLSLKRPTLIFSSTLWHLVRRRCLTSWSCFGKRQNGFPTSRNLTWRASNHSICRHLCRLYRITADFRCPFLSNAQDIEFSPKGQGPRTCNPATHGPARCHINLICSY